MNLQLIDRLAEFTRSSVFQRRACRYGSTLHTTAALLLAWTMPAAAHAGVLGVEITGARGDITESDVTLGWAFTTNQAIRVDQLGFWDGKDISTGNVGDGLLSLHEVGLWTNSGDLLASATIPIGTSASLVDGFRWEPITPVTLAAGRQFVLGALMPDDSTHDVVANGFYVGDVAFSTPSAITYDESRQVLGSSLAFPSDASFLLGNFGPNMEFAPASVPEPSTMVMALTGIVFAGGRAAWRKRSIKQSA